MKEFIISNQEASQRLDKYLKKLLNSAGSGFIYKMLRKKNIVLNDKKADGSEILSVNDSVKLYLSDETFSKFSGAKEQDSYFTYLSELDFSHIAVIFEDDDILILNKPAGILSQKAEETDISLNEEMLSYLIHTGFLTADTFQTFHPSVANRLDRNTSGIILAGKTLKGQQYLSDILKNRSLEKYYYALVHGKINEDSYINGFLQKDEHSNKVKISDQPKADAKPIETSYKVLKIMNGTTLLEVHLITGRSHQIRAHLSSIGHPILFDPKYGNRKFDQTLNFRCKYQLLHAHHIVFPDGRVFEAELPDYFKKAVK